MFQHGIIEDVLCDAVSFAGYGEAELRVEGLGFRGLGFRGLGFRGLGFRGLGLSV